ncbi:MAG: hypothetical protein ACOZCL_02825 [Bacillota bacterium]
MKKIILIALAAVLVFVFAACQGTDVVGKVAVTSFDELLKAIPEKVVSDETNNGWTLISPTGERFFWSRDFSTEGKADLFIEFDAKPFLTAGLDVTRLPGDKYAYISETDKLVIYSDLGDKKFEYKGEETAIDSFKKIVENYRAAVGYHEELDHYGVVVGEGNMFEWAKDMATNDKDIVFVLNPQPFIDAGVDPSKVNDWVFAKVKVMDENKKEIEVDKFLKPFNIR